MSIRVLDGNGNLKVDAVDAGVATESTLADALTALQLIDDLQGALKSQDTDELISRLVTSGGVEIDPATSDKQDTMITALQKIDDLQNALKSVDTDELITRLVDSSGTEIDPAKEGGNLADIKTAIEKLDDLQGALLSQDTDKLLSVLLGYDGANYQKMLTDSSGRQIVRPADGERLFGIEDIVFERVTEGSASAGSNSLNGDTVPAGEYWWILYATMWDDTNDVSGNTFLDANLDGGSYVLDLKNPLPQNTPLKMEGAVILGPSDYIRARFYSVTAGDNLYLNYAGYKFSAP